MTMVNAGNELLDYISRFDPAKPETRLTLDSFRKLEQCEEHEKAEKVLNISLIAVRFLNVYTSTLLGGLLAECPELLDKVPDTIQEIARGYQHIRQYNLTDKRAKSEDYLSFLLTAAGDMRSVLLAIAANVYELEQTELPDSLRRKVVRETQWIYSPLCHRLGFYRLKSHMDDLVLQYNNPEAYYMVLDKLQKTAAERESFIRRFIQPIDRALQKHKLSYRIKSRTKAISSIYAKMLKQDVPFEKVYDVFAIRIITDSKPSGEKPDCWRVYSVVTNLYKPQIKRLRDWISKPRENGYESLHITVETPDHRFVEVQIRSERMDDEAENGMAAHWRYKGGKGARIDFYLSKIRKAIEQKSFISFEQSLSSTKKLGEIFVFTPTGELKKLRQKATVLDFAFSIHTELGLRCSGARINGKIKSIREVLHNGDQVEIITSKKQKPTLDWLKYVNSAKAKNRIRKALDEQKMMEASQGKEILLRRLKNWKIDFTQELPEKLAERFNESSVTEFYRNIFLEKHALTEIKKQLTTTQQEALALEEPEQITEEEKLIFSTNDTLIINEMDRLNYRLAHCCNPVPGDAIFGFVTISRGITIHRKDCSNAPAMRQKYPYRILPARWLKKEEKNNFRAVLFVKGNDRPGILSELSRAVANTGTLLSVNIKTVGRHFRGTISVKVYDNQHLKSLIQSLQGHKNILEVYRKK